MNPEKSTIAVNSHCNTTNQKHNKSFALETVKYVCEYVCTQQYIYSHRHNYNYDNSNTVLYNNTMHNVSGGLSKT